MDRKEIIQKLEETIRDLTKENSEILSVNVGVTTSNNIVYNTEMGSATKVIVLGREKEFYLKYHVSEEK